MDLGSNEADVQTGENVLSVAQAYPEEPAVVPVAPAAEEPKVVLEEEAAAEVSNDAAKVPREYNFENPEPQAEVEVPSVDIAAEVPVAPLTPVVKPVNRYLPANKKKVFVELDQSAEAGDVEETALAAAAQNTDVAEDDDEEEEEEVAVVPVAPKKPARRVVKKPGKAAAAPAKPAKPALPAGTFFPIDFGGTSGGAIAIANSFSTGEGGSATSHAIAYGNAPDAATRARRPSTKRRH